MSPTAVKLSTRGLSKVFRKKNVEIEALRDISIDVRDGEFVSVVGASGCGKTTFLKLLDGLIAPSAGTVAIDGKTIDRPGSKIAFVFQHDGLLPWRTVTDNTVFGLEIQGRKGAESKRIAKAILRLVGLDGFDTHYPHELSGGMRQRVNLARALAVGVDVLLMDEPFAALDAQTRTIMQAELMRIWRETRKTVLLVTHQIDEAVYLSDRVLIFTARPGRLKEEIVVDLPRPRDLNVKWTPEFVRLTNHIWRSIEAEVRTGMSIEMQASATARR
ncbi:MAG: ABC transporter ATP-binding protein [Alphaproteobacteria bacterium]